MQRECKADAAAAGGVLMHMWSAAAAACWSLQAHLLAARPRDECVRLLCAFAGTGAATAELPCLFPLRPSSWCWSLFCLRAAQGDGIIAADRGYAYITFLVNMSQLLALYTLVWLYVILKNELLPF